MAEKKEVNFKCQNPQNGDKECNGKGLETANGELICSKCSWIQPIKKESDK